MPDAAFRSAMLPGFDTEALESLLLHLTVEDLKDLGITSVGHRRKLLDAILPPPTSPLRTAHTIIPSPSRVFRGVD